MHTSAPGERECLAVELRDHGLRVTGPRLAVLAHLRSDRSHPTPETVHAALRPELGALSLSTVYETLEAFTRAGLCRRVATRTTAMRIDGTADDHDHAVCRGCGTIMDVRRASPLRAPRPVDLPRGVELISSHIEYEVICAPCRQEADGA